MPLLFGSSGLSIAWTQPKLNRWHKRTTPTITFARLATGVVGFFGLYLASAYLPLATPGPKDAVLALSALALWKITDGSWQGLLDGALCALGGCVVELALVHSGIFFYYPGFTQLYGVPSWLPWLYLGGSIAGGNLGIWAYQHQKP